MQEPLLNKEKSQLIRHTNFYTILSILVGASGGLAFGLDIGSTGSSLDTFGFREQIKWQVLEPVNALKCGNNQTSIEYLNADCNIDCLCDITQINSDKSIIVLMFHIGSMLITPIVGSFDYGRKPSIFGACILFIFGALYQACAGWITNSIYTDLLVGRLFSGFGNGIILSTIPIYISEISTPNQRGKMVGLFQLSITIGILIAAGFNIYASTQVNGFRFSLGLQLIPCVLILIVWYWLAESPRFYIKKHQREKAEKVLHKLTKNKKFNEIQTNQIVEHELNDILQKTSQEEKGWTDLFSGTNLTVAITAGLIAALQNVTGVNFFMNYSVTIISNLNLNPFLGTIVLDIVNVIFTIVGLLIVDKVGRKSLLTVGTIVVIISYFIISIIYTVTDTETNQGAGYTILCFIYVFQISFAISWGQLGWIIPSEIFKNDVRNKGMALAAGLNMLFNIIFGDYLLNFLSSPNIMGAANTFWLLFALNLIIILPVTIYLLPETKLLSLEEIDQAFNYTFKDKNYSKFMSKNFKQTKQLFTCNVVNIYEGFPQKTSFTSV